MLKNSGALHIFLHAKQIKMHTCEKIATRGDFCAPFFFLLNKVVKAILGKVVGMFPIDCISLRFTVRYPADERLFVFKNRHLHSHAMCHVITELCADIKTFFFALQKP